MEWKMFFVGAEGYPGVDPFSRPQCVGICSSLFISNGFKHMAPIIVDTRPGYVENDGAVM